MMLRKIKKMLVLTLVSIFCIICLSARASFFFEKDGVAGLNQDVYRLAVQAYQSAVRDGVHLSKPIVTVIDYSLPSTQNRLWVVDLSNNKVLFNTLVAHGQGSGGNFATHFSNQSGTLASSIGLFVTEDTYIGKRGYSLKIKGLEKGFNEKAEARHIVMHPAWYVSKQFAKLRGSLGRSWGCPALDEKVSKPIIDTIKDGTLVFAYYPDQSWLQKSKFLHQG